MNTEDRMSGRWIGPFLSAALLMGACSSDPAAPDAAPPDESATLALVDESADDDATSVVEDTAADEPMVDDGPAAYEIEPIAEVEGLPGIDLTPEVFEELRSDEEGRLMVLAQMEAQGLAADEAECFLDNVSPDLFITFGTGGSPDEDQFAELLELLVLCDVSMGAVG